MGIRDSSVARFRKLMWSALQRIGKTRPVEGVFHVAGDSTGNRSCR